MLLIGICIPSIFCNISEAASTGVCLTCNGSPAAISQINTMTRELLGSIQTIGTEVPYAGKPVSPVRFEDGKFNPPKTTIMSKTLRWARESLGSLLAVGRIFINLNRYGGTEALDSKAILAKGKIYKRDWNKMEDIGQEIANKKFGLSVGGGRNEAIRNKTYNKMQDIIITYQDAGLLSKDSTLSPGVTYSQMIGTLENLNILTKNQIIRPNSSKLKDNIGKEGILLKISDTAVASISDAYKCVADQQCEGSRTELKTDLKNISEMGKSGIKNVGKIFADSTVKLANAVVGVVKDVGKGASNLGKGVTNIFKNKKNKKAAEEIGMTEDEYIALQSRYGLSATQMKTAGLNGYLNDKRRSQRQTIKKGFTDMIGRDNTKDLVLTSKNIKTNNPQEKSFKLTMLTSINDIIDEAAEQRDYVMMAQNADVLTRFGLLNNQLTELNRLVANEQDGLIKTLGEACKNQCSNITSKKCFY